MQSLIPAFIVVITWYQSSQAIAVTAPIRYPLESIITNPSATISSHYVTCVNIIKPSVHYTLFFNIQQHGVAIKTTLYAVLSAIFENIYHYDCLPGRNNNRNYHNAAKLVFTVALVIATRRQNQNLLGSYFSAFRGSLITQ